MPEFTYTLHENYLELAVLGGYDFDDSLDEFAALLKKAKEERKQNILVDYRQLKGIYSSVEKVLYSLKAEQIYGSYLRKRGLPLRIAYLASSIEHEPGAEIGRKVSGLSFEIFDDKDEAMRWLLFKV